MPSQRPRTRTVAGKMPAAETASPRPTSAIKALWTLLRERRKDGFHFRRDVRFEGGTADFHCEAARLIVQVVGGMPRSDSPAIARNETALAASGLRVLRVPAGIVARDPRIAARLVTDALMESGHSPGPAKSSKHHFGPGPVGDSW